MPPKENKQLTFLVDTNPFDATSKANKKRVRSIAALKSWPERRKRTFEQLEGSGSHTTFFLNPPEFSTTPRTSSDEVRSKKQTTNRAAERTRIKRASRARRTQSNVSPVDPSETSRGTAITSDIEKQSSQSPNTYDTTGEIGDSQAFSIARLERRTSDVTASSSTEIALLTPPSSPGSSPSPPVGGAGDPFGCYPVERKPWFDGILHHMLTVFAPRGWPALKITQAQGLHWEWFMTQHALSDPALFYVRLLFASGDLISLGVLNPNISYWLRAQAIRAINEALADPKRATSDALILAVGRIAFHESMYGDRQAANTIHRPAQQRMIMMRGGMGALEFPELVKRLMRWADKVMSLQGGTQAFLDDDAKVENFTMKQSVNVLEEWVPKEGMSLRTKFKDLTIADNEDDRLRSED